LHDQSASEHTSQLISDLSAIRAAISAVTERELIQKDEHIQSDEDHRDEGYGPARDIVFQGDQGFSLPEP